MSFLINFHMQLKCSTLFPASHSVAHKSRNAVHFGALEVKYLLLLIRGIHCFRFIPFEVANEWRFVRFDEINLEERQRTMYAWAHKLWRINAHLVPGIGSKCDRINANKSNWFVWSRHLLLYFCSFFSLQFSALYLFNCTYFVTFGPNDIFMNTNDVRKECSTGLVELFSVSHVQRKRKKSL